MFLLTSKRSELEVIKIYRDLRKRRKSQIFNSKFKFSDKQLLFLSDAFTVAFQQRRT